MNYGLNASYLSKNLFEDLLNDFSLISYATPENTQRYRSLDNDKTNDYSFQLQMEGNDLITKSHTHIDSLRELAKGLFSFHRDIKHYLVGDLKKLYLEYLDIYRQL
jgi:mRNA-degrading endonuclease HigB of HigAB toxin-antitoxin module